MKKTLLELEDKTYTIFHHTLTWLLIAIAFFVAWYFKSTMASFIISALVGLILLVFQSDMRLTGIYIMLLFMSLGALPYFDTLGVGVYGMIASGSLCVFLMYIKRRFIFKKTNRTFGSIGSFLVILTIWSFISSIINQFTSFSKYSFYGYMVDLLVLLFTALYLMIVNGSDKKDDSFLSKEMYIINICLLVENIVQIILTNSPDNGFDLGWGTKNLVAIVYEFCLPFMSLIISKNNKRIDAILLLIADYAMIVLSDSRGAMITVGILTILLCVILAFRSKRSIIHDTYFLLMIFCLATIILILVPGPFHDSVMRMIAMGGDLSNRETIWEQAMLWFNYSPVAGGSYSCLFDIYEYMAKLWAGGVFPSGVVGIMLCHNNFITFLASLGVIGLLAFLYHMVEMIYSAFKCQDKSFCLVILYVVAFSFIHGMIENTYYSIAFMFPLMIIFADPNLASLGDKIFKKSNKKQTSVA